MVLRLLLHGQALLGGSSSQDRGHECLILGHGVLQGEVALIRVARVVGFATLDPLVDTAGPR